MNPPDPQPKLPDAAPEAPVISYASSAAGPAAPVVPAIPLGPRRWWVYGVVGIYLLLLAALLTGPIWIDRALGLGPGPDREPSLYISAAVVVTLLTLGGLGMLLTPVRVGRRRPMTRRSILIPIIASGFLLGLKQANPPPF